MRTRTFPQKYCPDVTDHRAHGWFMSSGRVRDIEDLNTKRCPGRYTPSNYHAPAPSPAQPTDPFAGIDEDEGR